MIAKVAANWDMGRLDGDFVFFDRIYFCGIDNVRLVDAQEGMGSDILFYVFERQKCHVFSFLSIYTNVVLHSFDVQDIVKENFLVLVLTLYEKVTIRVRTRTMPANQLKVIPCFRCRLEKPVKGDGL